MGPAIRGARRPQPGAVEQGPAPRGDMVPGEQPPGETGLTLAPTVRLTAWLRGRVQGVGFRWWVRSQALELGLAGWAENLADGRVKVVAEGPREACAQLLELLDGGDTPGQVASMSRTAGTRRAADLPGLLSADGKQRRRRDPGDLRDPST